MFFSKRSMCFMSLFEAHKHYFSILRIKMQRWIHNWSIFLQMTAYYTFFFYKTVSKLNLVSDFHRRLPPTTTKPTFFFKAFIHALNRCPIAFLFTQLIFVFRIKILKRAVVSAIAVTFQHVPSFFSNHDFDSPLAFCSRSCGIVGVIQTLFKNYFTTTVRVQTGKF